MNKTGEDPKVKTESIKETQTEGNLEMKNLGTLAGTREVNLPNRIQEMEEDIEDMIEEMYTLVKENVSSKDSWCKTSRKP